LVVVGLGTRHTLASYLSMQTVPDTTASAGHDLSGPLGGAAAVAESTSVISAPAIEIPRTLVLMVVLLCWERWGDAGALARGRAPW